jgi:AraC-like DNA-binding protein
MFGSTKLFSPDSPGMTVLRTGSSGRLDPMIALCVQIHGTGLSVEDGFQHQLLPGDLVMVGPTSPNEFRIDGATFAIEIPFDEIGVTVELARKASEQLPASPLYRLVGRHLLTLRADADEISQSTTASEVGEATAQLVRALIISAALDDRSSRSALGDALALQVFAYIREHLTDRNITPTSIARAHNISVRYLYKLCEAADIRLVEWIIDERLKGARRDLLAADQAQGSIAVVARKWGFKDPSHFSNRFRSAFGVSPRDLQKYSRHECRDQF